MTAVKIILLLGFAGVVIAVVALLFTQTPIRKTLACDRASGFCTLTQRQLAKTSSERFPIASIDRAEVRTVRGRGGSPQVWLVTSSTDHYFASYEFRSSADDVAQQINAWRKNPSATARLDLDDGTGAMYWAAWALVPIVAAALAWLGFVLFRKAPPAVKK